MYLQKLKPRESSTFFAGWIFRHAWSFSQFDLSDQRLNGFPAVDDVFCFPPSVIILL
jgi:hypothetical protein